MSRVARQEQYGPQAVSPALEGPPMKGDQRGFAMVEMVVSTAILGGVILTLLAAISTGSIAIDVKDTRVEVNRLAQSQMEFVLSEPYLVAPATYPTIATPPGYSLTAVSEPVAGADANIQKVTVSVFRNGELQRTLTAFKVNR